MMEALGVVLGALSRRIWGWGYWPKWVGLAFAIGGAGLILLPHLPLWHAAIFMGLVALMFLGLPVEGTALDEFGHGETANAAYDGDEEAAKRTSLRYGFMTLVLATIGVWLGYPNAVWYGFMGLLAGPLYYLCGLWDWENTGGPGWDFIDGSYSIAELGLGTILVSALVLLIL